MVKSVRTTQSANRYTFQSFRDRVESIKIEPSKNLRTRAFDEVDDSHFLSSLDRWVEFNRTATFTQFVFDIRDLAQSLPQIIYFKEKIFDLLSEAILKQDAIALQPLLEALTQFCHDLGPDFMVFYDRSITMITKLALGENDSDTLEWEFNALAFIFKYLSKTLSQDLLPTFNLLEPLLKAKSHIARFCSEALSFLIRKTNAKQLSIFTNFAFDKIESDIQYQKSFVILFSEALKSTKGSIHSKSTIILGTLLDRLGTEESSSALSDILMNIIAHGSQENVDDIYKLVLVKITASIKQDHSFINHYIKILTSLIFAQSGKKIPDWKSVIDSVQYITDNIPGKDLSRDTKGYLVFLFTILIRNCEIQFLTRFHNALFKYAMSLDDLFLPFIISISDVSKQKTLKFAPSYIQAFVNGEWNNRAEDIGLFIQDLSDRDLLSATDDPSKFKVILPQSLCEVIYEDLGKISLDEPKDLYEVYWRLSLLGAGSKVFNAKDLVKVFGKILQLENSSKFQRLILSVIISLLVDNKGDGVDTLILNNFELLATEHKFLSSVTKFVKTSQQSGDLTKYIKLLSVNLSQPDDRLRSESLNLISTLASSFDEDLVTVSNQASIIEQLPLDFSLSRDFGIRVRNFANIIKNFDEKDDLKSEVFFSSLFGFLNKKFSPMWNAVVEVLPSVSHKNEKLIWKLVYHVVTRNSIKQDQDFLNFFIEEDSTYETRWTIIEPRLESTVGAISNVINKYINKKSTYLQNAESKHGYVQFPDFISVNALKSLKAIPHIAERNSTALVSLILEDDEEYEKLLNRKEQALVYEILAIFKKLQKIPKADELRHKLLRVLSSKHNDTRQLALNALFNYHNNSINKYKDNLTNLLDDAVFRDELSKIFARNGESVVEDADLDQIMPIILRILFGRAQTNVSSGNKKGLKVSSIHILVSMERKHVEQFLEMISEKVPHDDDLDLEEIDQDYMNVTNLRICLGYVNLLADVISTLGEKFLDILPLTLKPLLFSLIEAQRIITSENSYEDSLVSIAKTVRQAGMKDLLLLFKLLRDYNWDEYLEVIYEKIFTPRFKFFEIENLQQPSSLLKILLCWTEHPQYYDLLMISDLEPVKNVLSLLSNPHTKPQVLNAVFDFSTNVINSIPKKSKFSDLQSLVSSEVFSSLDGIFDRVTDPVLSSKAISLLLALVGNKHVKDQERRSTLVDLATKLLEKPSTQISKQAKIQVLQTLKSLIDDFEGEFSGIQHLYEVCSKFLKTFHDNHQRKELVEVFVSIGEKFEEYIKVASLIEELNSFSSKNLAEFDFERRLTAYREINDELYASFSVLEWLPILNDSLYYINSDDISIRTNASYTLRRFIDAISLKESPERKFTFYFKDLLLPNLRIGLRDKKEVVQTEFIILLAHIVKKIKHVEDFEDLKILVSDGQSEDNFFENIIHIQLSKRQQAVRSLIGLGGSIKASNIAHYVLPIIENYAYCSDEKMRNISNEAIETIEHLVTNVTYKQYLAVFKRYLGGLKEGSVTQRDSVSLIVAVSRALSSNVQSPSSKKLEGLPEDPIAFDVQIEEEMIAPISKILNIRNEDTVLHRVPLIQALASLTLCLSHDRIVFVLPGLLTKVCQILRTRYDDLREATRKYLGRASNILGPKYIKFIIKELKTALGKGFQVHVLGYTVNSVLLATNLEHGDLDDSASLIMDVVMENLFGAVSQEKESDGYRTTMKEVKSNKSFDTAELLSQYISLSNFGDIINPIKLLLKERITYRIQNKLDELLRKISQGVFKNNELKSQSMLVLCFELFKEAETYANYVRPAQKVGPTKDEHFIVQLDAKPLKVENENSIYVDTFQKLALELLRTTLSKNPDFVTVEKLSGFLPSFEKSLESENEKVLVSVLRILIVAVDLEFDSEKDIFEVSAQKCLEVIQDYPSTDSEVVQACYKYLSSIIRHREDLSLKESSIGYLLTRLQPDMTEQNRQGLAFNFLKAILAKHLVIAEVYDTMDKVREVMVTSHSKERRDASRSIYYQFIMEYDQGRGRLEKQFKFLVDNLSYPAEDGKQSVMELVHLIIGKSGPQLLEALSSSFFVALAKILISETKPKTRQMAVALITSIFEKMGTEKYEKYISGWMNSKNSALLKCSLQLYRIKLKVDGIDKDNMKQVDEDVLINIKDILERSRTDSDIEVSWELIYSALNCLSVIVEKDHEVLDEELSTGTISALLYPHSWVRLVSSRIVTQLISKEGVLDNSDIQNISNRLIHQLRVPTIDEDLSSQSVKFLTLALIKWEKESITFDKSLLQNDEEDEDEEEEEKEEEEELEADKKEDEEKETLMSDWVVSKISGIIRSVRVSIFSKKAGIQLLGIVSQVLEEDRLLEIAQDIILPLFNLSENYSELANDVELKDLSSECLKMIENKVGISRYTDVYNKVRTYVMGRRQERKTKRARLAITAPEAVARRKIKKHEKEKNKRKRERESGFYRGKRPRK